MHYVCAEGLQFSAFHWVCVCVCLSVRVSVNHISPMEHLFVRRTLSRTQRTTKVKKFVGICTYSADNEGQKICGDLPKTTAFKSYAVKHDRKSQYANYSDLPAVSFLQSEAPEDTQRLSTTFSLVQNDA